MKYGKCRECNSKVLESDKLCPTCGASVETTHSTEMILSRPKTTYSAKIGVVILNIIVTFILWISISYVVTVTYSPLFIMGIIGILLSIIAYIGISKIKNIHCVKCQTKLEKHCRNCITCGQRYED
tara:strand:+ start:312 stop:689 length:378 start_codon:yes stop_codon:yes gene_type:complete